MGQPTVAEVKQQARTLGADLVGIASAEAVRENPVPGCPHTLEDMLAGARSAVVVARRLLWGMTREPDPANRNVHYAGELALTRLEELCYDLAAFLEDNGQPSIALPAAYSRSHQVDLARQTLSLPHLAVEAGLGTLGLNLQLLTREFGPRVILGAVVTRAASSRTRLSRRPSVWERRAGAVCWPAPATPSATGSSTWTPAGLTPLLTGTISSRGTSAES